MTVRYKVVDGSQSAHCCFVATVVDTSRPVIINGQHYKGEFEPVCECFDEADAGMICAALNASAQLQEDKDDAERYRHLCEPREWSEDIQAAFDCSGNKFAIDAAVDASRARAKVREG